MPRLPWTSRRAVSVAVKVLILALLGLYALWGTILSSESFKTLTSTSSTTPCHHSGNPTIVYGHLHMAKTAGTTINAKLALLYERVCGNKGFSFNAYQRNEINKQEAQMFHGNALAKPIPMEDITNWGLEDCDYISMETAEFDAEGHGYPPFWEQTSNDLYRKANLTMELHIPCRDPLEHLMSLCNYKRKEFNCSNPDLEQEFWRCNTLGRSLRFHINFTKLPHVVTKCFNPIPADTYIHYMGQRLQPRRVTDVLVNISTNRPRQRDSECIWKDQNQHVRDQMLKIMLDMDYYKYCSNCIGTKDDLLLLPT